MTIIATAVSQRVRHSLISIALNQEKLSNEAMIVIQAITAALRLNAKAIAINHVLVSRIAIVRATVVKK